MENAMEISAFKGYSGFRGNLRVVCGNERAEETTQIDMKTSE